MNGWQITATIISVLTFARIIIKDILEHIEKKADKKKAQTSQPRRKRHIK